MDSLDGCTFVVLEHDCVVGLTPDKACDMRRSLAVTARGAATIGAIGMWPKIVPSSNASLGATHPRTVYRIFTIG